MLSTLSAAVPWPLVTELAVRIAVAVISSLL
jgi:hypothetical protein